MDDPIPFSPCPCQKGDLHALMNAAPHICILLDVQGRILSFNEAGLKHLRVPQDEVTGQNFFALFPAEIAKTRQKVFHRVLVSGQSVDYEDSRDGRLFAFTAVPIRSYTGQITKIALFAEDITEKRQIESRLAENEAKYRFLAENAGDIVWQLDADMRYTYVSPSSERLRGYRAEELIGRWVFDVYTPQGFEIVQRNMAERDKRRERGEEVPSICFEAPQYRKDRSIIWTETTSTRITDAQGKLLGYVGITRDVDERIRSRTALEEINNQLRLRLEEISALQARLLDMAIHDALTGIHNRHYLDEMLVNEIARAQRSGAPLSVVLVDIDHFKRINDEYGHHAGDQVLCEVAKILSSSSRKSDVVCRWGGEEFLILLPEMSIEHACIRAQAWRRVLEQQGFPGISRGLRVTASFGCAALDAEDQSADDLIQAADAALYRSKENGRNQVSQR